MYAIDFEYDNRLLSDYGFIICNFDSSSGATVATAGSNLSFNTVSRHNGKKYGLVGVTYKECMESTFDICKNPDEFNDLEISSEEYRDLMRWLNRNRFLKFRLLNEEKELEPCYYEASFNLSKITIAETLYGIRLSMNTNRPFGFGETKYKVFDITDSSMIHILADDSDEIGDTYPNLSITCYEDGDLEIENITCGCKTIFLNCSEGEIITVCGDTFDVSSSEESHNIYNDFNYEYFKISNQINNRSNEIKVSLPCKIEITYAPTIKNIL